jgi:hypothetical protein
MVNKPLNLDQDLLTQAIGVVVGDLLREGVVPHGPLTHEQTVLSMRKQKSPGYPSSLSGFPTKDLELKNFPHLCEYHYNEGYKYVTPVYLGSEKEEMLSKEKVEAQNFRLYSLGV